MTKCVQRRNRLRNSVVLGLTVVLFVAPLARGGQNEVGYNSRALSLNDCIALALNESPVLEASRLDVTSAAEDARAARDQTLPEITGRASYQLFSGSPTSKFSIVDAGTGIGIGVNSAIDVGSGRNVFGSSLLSSFQGREHSWSQHRPCRSEQAGSAKESGLDESPQARRRYRAHHRRVHQYGLG